MKVVLLGGGSGGHFYPLIAVARALREVAEEERIVTLDLIYMGERPYNPGLLSEEGIFFDRVPAGKIRRYFSIRNITDSLKTLAGIVQVLWKFTLNPPDVIFSKGGYDAFPTLVIARLYRIPVIIHESDSIPGKVNEWSAKFAAKIGVSFPEAARHFPTDKTALVGNPIRRAVIGGSETEAFETFGLESGIPTVLVLGGSQGAQAINDAIIEALPDLLAETQVIHATGEKNFEGVRSEAEVILEKSVHQRRYHPYGLLNDSQLRNASFAADVIISRAGAGSIFEIAAWGDPAILIPLPESAQDHQRENAYNYARTGAAEVLEQSNLTPHVLVAEVIKILKDQPRRDAMRKSATAFARIDAAEKIAREIILLGIHD